MFEPDALEEFKGIPTSEPHDSVVIGLSPSSFHYDMVKKKGNLSRLLVIPADTRIQIAKNLKLTF